MFVMKELKNLRGIHCQMKLMRKCKCVRCVGPDTLISGVLKLILGVFIIVESRQRCTGCIGVSLRFQSESCSACLLGSGSDDFAEQVKVLLRVYVWCCCVCNLCCMFKYL